MTNSVTTMYTLLAPKVQYSSTFDSQHDSVSTWRAQLQLSYLDEGGSGVAPHVVGGCAEFAIINVGEHPIADLLDSLSPDAAQFASLFEGNDVAPAVQEQWEDAPFNRVLVITHVEIAEPLRGHALGAWLVADVIARMSSPIDTLVLLYPHPAGPHASSAAELAAAESLSYYWHRCGLVPVEYRPDFLGGTTAYSHIANAREALQKVRDVRVAVPASLIRLESPADPRHTVMPECEPEPQARPVGLRLVRD
ncbi:hypothetical protein [Mycolicibacterium llatzerense]|uniref:hypothetical protein n=1 Tax=Mycolicibacterium llatzerense TaxID=280871 RepID=UPI0021B68F5C|nr:hypothetical protein [Mycolicibacterium llatzerense]MCT7371908.1 hypothetical protein [Mycolicibacterium llatzerense]